MYTWNFKYFQVEICIPNFKAPCVQDTKYTWLILSKEKCVSYDKAFSHCRTQISYIIEVLG